MAELLDISWPALVLVLVVFGFAPGVCLRLIVLVYPRNDPRRAELVAELYAVPRGQRPLWVAEQLEVALFEGLPHRVSAIRRGFARQRRDQAPRRPMRILSPAALATASLSVALFAQLAQSLMVSPIMFAAAAVVMALGLVFGGGIYAAITRHRSISEAGDRPPISERTDRAEDPHC